MWTFVGGADAQPVGAVEDVRGTRDVEKLSFVVATTKAAQEKGIAAGKLVPSFAEKIGGRGGGKPDMDQGGGTNPGV